MQWIYETLGIDANADASAIRKGYARAIKQCDRATEAERFQRIRQAYELALQRAAQRNLSGQTPGHEAHEATVVLAIESARQAATPENAADQEWLSLWDEFLQAYSGSDEATIAHILGAYADDVRLTSLDAKADFERAILVLAFSTPVNIALLDAACDLFVWETSNRHLVDARPDFVHRLHRLHRQQILRHLLENNRHRDDWYLQGAKEAHARRFTDQPPSWQIGKVNHALDRYAAFKRELDERYGPGMFDWWRQLRADEQGHVKSPRPMASPATGAPDPNTQSPKSFRKLRPRVQQSTTSHGAAIFAIAFMALMSLVNQYSKTGPGVVVPVATRLTYEPAATVKKVVCRPSSHASYADRLLRVPLEKFTYPGKQSSNQLAPSQRLQAPYAPDYQGATLDHRAGSAADASENCPGSPTPGDTAPPTEQ